MTGSSTSLSQASIILLCLDGFLKHDWIGRLYTRSRTEPSYFHGTLKLLKSMDQFYEQIGYPRAALDCRSFTSDSDREKNAGKREETGWKNQQITVLSEEELRKNKGELATLLIRIQYRQLATLQGRIIWLEQNESADFCSAMEFLKLIDSLKTPDVKTFDSLSHSSL